MPYSGIGLGKYLDRAEVPWVLDSFGVDLASDIRWHPVTSSSQVQEVELFSIILWDEFINFYEFYTSYTDTNLCWFIITCKIKESKELISQEVPAVVHENQPSS